MRSSKDILGVQNNLLCVLKKGEFEIWRIINASWVCILIMMWWYFHYNKIHTHHVKKR